MSASERKADVPLTQFTDDLRRNGAPDPGAARGKCAFPKLIKDPVDYAAAISKGPFSEIFLKNKKIKTRI